MTYSQRMWGHVLALSMFVTVLIVHWPVLAEFAVLAAAWALLIVLVAMNVRDYRAHRQPRIPRR